MSVMVGGPNSSFTAENKTAAAMCPSSSSSSSSSNNGETGEAGPSSCDDARTHERLYRQFSTASLLDSDDDNERDLQGFSLGPLVPLKQQLEKDMDDESLRRWKQQLLGGLLLDAIEDGVDPEVKLLSLSILSEGRPDILVDLASLRPSKQKPHLFTLKEGSCYNLKFSFSVHRNLVSGLTYHHVVWKNGIRVDNTRVMLGTFAPQREPHVVVMEEETTPSGMLARGSYTAKTRFMDDDGRCHFEIEHTFDIRKDW